MSSMDNSANYENTSFSDKFEHSPSEISLKNNTQLQNLSGNVEEKIRDVTLKTLLKKAQEKRKTKEDRKDGKGGVCVSTSLESLHVQRVYDQIAPHIEDLKQRTWPRVKEFLKSLKPGSLVADIGCGNGRYLHINPSIFKIGSDICQPFLRTAAARGFEVLSADNLQLPYRDELFDAAISIGVIHHFASKERRVRALRELVRILVPGGLMMVYVWAFEQKYRKFDSQDILVPWHKPRQADSGRRLRPRTSSLSEVDHLSTSSTGSSLSDEDFSPCMCHQPDLNSDACHFFQLGAVESCNAYQCSPDLREQRKNHVAEECVHKHNHVEQDSNLDSFELSCAYRSSDCPDGGLNLSCLENKLSRGEALIRECQKVESYLSSLCKSPWEFLPIKSKSSTSSLLKNTSSLGSFEEGALTSTTKSSPSCQSLSLQDDDVFLEKLDSPVLDSPARTDSSPIRSLQGIQQLVPGTSDGSLLSDPHLYSSKELPNNFHTYGSLPSSSDQNKRAIDSFGTSSVRAERGVWKASSEKHPSGTRKLSLSDKGKALYLKHGQEKQPTGSKFSCSEDDFYIVDIESEGVVPLPVGRIASSNGHRVNSPRGVLDTLKQGLKNIFSKTKQENGRQAAPCLVPCLAAAFPQEQFQIREFPQSSLPSSTFSESNTPFAFGSCTSGQDAGLDVSVSSCQDIVKKSGDSQFQTLSQNNFTYHLTKGQSKCQMTASEYHSSDTDTVRKKCHSQSSKSEPEVTQHSISTNRTLSCEETSTPRSSSGKSKRSKSLKLLPKLDSINTDLCRFYHVFREGELEELVTEHIAGVRVVDSLYDHANWCVIFEKI